MQPILIVGTIIFGGFLMGELATRVKLPKITGYILAGILLNPAVFELIPSDFVNNTGLITKISLSFITFSVGGTLAFPKLKALGKSIVWITICEAEFAFLFILVSFAFLVPLFIHFSGAAMATVFLPFAFLSAALAAPTDPSATLAVEHEYHAKGEVTATVMGVAAFDDILGIINYSIAVSVSGMLILSKPFGVNSVLVPFLTILGSIVWGIVAGFIFNKITSFIRKESEGVLIVLIFGFLMLCYGIAELLDVDQLLATMSMGAVVVNYNPFQERIFGMIERYTEELIFVLFFTLSAMHLDFSVLLSNAPLILLFVVFRALGKFAGTFVGATASQSSIMVKKYTAGGLIPQGGIVIGLALLLKQNTEFAAISGILVNVIIGATIIHEIIGPLFSKMALAKAGELEA